MAAAMELQQITEEGTSSGTATARMSTVTSNRQENESNDTGGGRCRYALRLVAATFVFLVVLACSTVCKLTLFYLEVKLFTILNPPVPVTTHGHEFPIQPSINAVFCPLQGTLSALLEVLSMAFLVLWALPASPSVGLISVNSIFIFAVLTKSFNYFSDAKNHTRQRKIMSIVQGVASLALVCVMIAGLIFTIIQNQYWSKREVWEITVSLGVLSLCWTPVFQEFTVLKKNAVRPENQERGSSSGPNIVQNNTACWKLGIITNLVKCMAWALCVFVFYPVMREKPILGVNWHVIPLCSDESYAVFAAFLANGLCGAFGFGFAVLALKMRMQNSGFLAPIVVSNIAVSLFLILGIHTPLCKNMTLPEFGPCDEEWNSIPTDLIPVLCTSLMFVFTLIGMSVHVFEVQGMQTIVMEKDSNVSILQCMLDT